MTIRLPGDRRGFLGLIAVYFLLQFALRVTSGYSLELDEGEQMILGQQLQAGYTGQPPLYTWLQIGFFTVFGQGIVALSLLKNLLLFLTYAGTYFAARRLGVDTILAAAAALSLLLLGEIGWESQRDLTHSVLVTTMAALTLWLGCTMVSERPHAGHYLLLGVLMGLGMLSKWNYLFFLLAWILAAYSLDRRLILRPAFLLSLSLAAVVVSPYALWIRQSLDVATASMRKLDATGSASLQSLGDGLVSLPLTGLQFCIVFIVVFGLTIRTWPRGWAPSRRDGRPAAVLFLLRLFWISLALLLAYLTIAGASTLRERWLLPVLFYVPLLFFALAPVDAFSGRAIQRYTRVLLAAAILITTGLQARYYAGPLLDKYTKPHFPGAALAQALADCGDGPLPIVAERSLISGNLKLHLPTRFVTHPPVDFQLPAGTDVLLVWDAEKGTAVPNEMMGYLRGRSPDVTLVDAPTDVLEAPLRLSRSETFRLACRRARLR